MGKGVTDMKNSLKNFVFSNKIFCCLFLSCLFFVGGCSKPVSQVQISKIKTQEIQTQNIKTEEQEAASDFSEDSLKVVETEVSGKSMDRQRYENLMLVNKDNVLPEDFVPNLKEFEDQGRKFCFDESALGCLLSMIESAKKDGINLFVVSAYRSNQRQAEIFNNKLQQWLDSGLSQEEAFENTQRYIAPPGTSEHATGLAVDLNSLEEEFDQTPEYRWLCSHASEFGFILRYQKEKEDVTKIAYEPWHYRYVGREHAEKIKTQNICLEEYLDK